MIALISFLEQLYLPEDEAQKMKLKYNKLSQRMGIKDDKLQTMWSNDYYVDELIYNGMTEKYYTAEGESVSRYDIYERPKRNDYVEVQQKMQLVDLAWFLEVCPYRFCIDQYVKQTNASIEGIQGLLDAIEQKTLAVNATLDVLNQSTFNQKCNVHVGGGLIATYNDLKLKENSCTDELQRELNDGWRIIAACIQPNQRRPDYILGRYNPVLDASSKSNADR